jgi:hypothetical protein
MYTVSEHGKRWKDFFHSTNITLNHNQIKIERHTPTKPQSQTEAKISSKKYWEV